MIKKLERRLGLGAVVAISVGSMLGSGIFVLPGVGFTITGSSLFLAYLCSAFCILPAAMSKSELATAMPTSGGTYVYLERTFGPLAGVVAGLGLYLSMLLKSAFALVGFGAYLEIVANIPLEQTALFLLGFIVIINILGVSKVSGLLGIITAISIVTLFALSIYSFPSVKWNHFEPFLAKGGYGLVEAIALVFISFAGVTKIAAIAEEIKNPGQNLPRGILFSLILVTTIYCVLTFILAGVIPMESLAGNLRPIYSLTKAVLGPTWAMGMAIIAILTMSSVANAGLLAASRFPFAMSRDQLLPNFLSRIHPRFLTPFWSIILSGILIALVIWTIDVVRIAKLASAFIIIMFMFVNLAVIVLRETRVQWYQPVYRSPLYPFIQIFGILACLSLLISMGLLVPLAIMTISVPGLLIYFFFSRKQTDRRGVLGIRIPRKESMVEEFDRNQKENQEMEFDKGAPVIVAMFGNERAPEVLTQMGLALTGGQRLEITHVTEIPEQTDLDDIGDESVQVRSIRRRVQHMSKTRGLDVRFNALVSHDIYRTIRDISQRMLCEWLVVEWGGRSRDAFTLNDTMRSLNSHLSCHLMTFRDKGVLYFKKILVIVKSERSHDLLLTTAEHLADVHGAEITLATYLHESNREIYEENEEFLRKISKSYLHVVDWFVLSGGKDWELFCQLSVEFDLVILESSSSMTFYQRLFGSPEDKIMEHSACSVVNITDCKGRGSEKSLSRKIFDEAQEVLLSKQ